MYAENLPFSLWEGPEWDSRVRSRVSDVWAAELRRDPRLRRVWWVVELVMGDGTRWRVGGRLLSTSSPDGSDRSVMPALLGPESERQITNQYTPGQPSTSARSFSLAVPGNVIRVADRLASGLPLAGFGEVSLLAEGMSWQDRRVVLRGDVSGGVSFGSAHEAGDLLPHLVRAVDEAQAVRFQLQDPRTSADRRFPAEPIDVTAWPAASEAATGKLIPHVFGSYVVPVRRVETTPTVLGCAYTHDATIDEVWQEDTPISGGLTVSDSHDGRGRRVTIATDTSGGAITWGDNDELYARVTRTASPQPTLVQVLREAAASVKGGQALVSELLLSEAEARMPGVATVGTAANRDTTLIQWVERDLLKDWPMVSMVWDAGKWGPVVTDWRTRPTFDLVAGTADLGHRLGEWTETPKREFWNSFAVRYGYDARLDSWAGVVTADPDNDPLCRASAEAIGVRPAGTLDGHSIPNAQAALYVLDWRVSHQTLPTLTAEFPAPAGAFLRYRRGDTGYVTDPRFYGIRFRVTIEGIRFKRGQAFLLLRAWPDPLGTGF